MKKDNLARNALPAEKIYNDPIPLSIADRVNMEIERLEKDIGNKRKGNGPGGGGGGGGGGSGSIGASSGPGGAGGLYSAIKEVEILRHFYPNLYKQLQIEAEFADKPKASMRSLAKFKGSGWAENKVQDSSWKKTKRAAKHVAKPFKGLVGKVKNTVKERGHSHGRGE